MLIDISVELLTLGLAGCEHLGVGETADIGLLWNTEGV